MQSACSVVYAKRARARICSLLETCAYHFTFGMDRQGDDKGIRLRDKNMVDMSAKPGSFEHTKAMLASETAPPLDLGPNAAAGDHTAFPIAQATPVGQPPVAQATPVGQTMMVGQPFQQPMPSAQTQSPPHEGAPQSIL